MGPEVDSDFKSLQLRPYQTSMTFANLKRTRQGVLHVTDDVELFARAAIGPVQPPPTLIPAGAVDGYILADACRWFAFRVTAVDDDGQPARIDAVVVDRGTQRDFFGFNRAKHAVLEAAILATRITRLPPAQIQADMDRLAVLVAKTAGPQERRAFGLLNDYLRNNLRSTGQPGA
ncbi:MAG: hypothetical protein A2W31_18215 [Planctomycetes bacterium RBG_16_64_10]|nr:MAG: hypothetical protein A2W31_18215 [Planctomycetes bacterium RBG_16_64_10]